MILKRTIKLLKEYLRMNNLELTDINKYRLNEINKTKDYFNNEVNERKDIIKKFNKYIFGFDYLENIYYFISIIWYFKYSFTRYSSRYTSRYCKFFFDFNIYNKYGINKSLLKVTKKRKKKHNKIIALAKSKLNTIDTLLSSALNDSKVSHEEMTNIITEQNIYENIKENIKDTAKLSSLERTIESSSSERTAEPSALARIKEEEEKKLTTLQKSFKILIIF